MAIPVNFAIALDKLHLDPSFKAIIAAAVVAGQQFDFDLYARNAGDNRDVLKEMFKVVFDQIGPIVARSGADTDHFEAGCISFEESFGDAFFDIVKQQNERAPKARQYGTTHAVAGRVA